MVQHCLCDNILRPYFENRLTYDNAACREGKGTDFARDRLTGFLREHYKKYGTKGYILKYDIRHYFDSIDHEILKGMLRSIPDRNVLGLLFHIIRSYEGTIDPVKGRKKGLPLGNQTSQWFALYYLDPMDRLVKERMRIKHYVRYMDDGVRVLFCGSPRRKNTCCRRLWTRELSKHWEWGMPHFPGSRLEEQNQGGL